MNELSPTADLRQRPLTWGLCVATLNRLETLEKCVRCATEQTRPPAEIVIADASEDWNKNRECIANVLVNSAIELKYLRSSRRSSAAQRNLGLSVLVSDIAFMVDDDSLMEPDCAEVIMAIYEQDEKGAVAGISAINVQGEADAKTQVVKRKNTGGLRLAWVQTALRRSALARWFLKEVMMMSRDRIFIKYDKELNHFDWRDVEQLDIPDVKYTEFLPGWGMTVRREIALREPFDNNLLAYCPTEDLDASYRFGRHGVNVVASQARIRHVEVAAGRIKRQKATTLSILNSAYFTRRSSTRIARHAAAFYVFAVRRVFAELLKDLLTGRVTFPQLRGAVSGLFGSLKIFLRPRDGLGSWYESYQMKVLSK